jgi:uncharacterized protein YggE
LSEQGVSVTGSGRVAVRPDLVIAQLGAEVTAGSVQAALDGCTAALSAVSAALRGHGVEGGDLGSAGASVYAAHDPHGVPHGWTASQQLTARIHDVAAAGAAVSAALAAGGDAARLYSLALGVDDPEPARAQARELAFAEAQATAELYARLAGRRLGLVRTVTEGGVAGTAPGTTRAYAAKSAMEVEPGSLDVTVGVTVQWDFAG